MAPHARNGGATAATITSPRSSSSSSKQTTTNNSNILNGTPPSSKKKKKKLTKSERKRRKRARLEAEAKAKALDQEAQAQAQSNASQARGEIAKVQKEQNGKVDDETSKSYSMSKSETVGKADVRMEEEDKDIRTSFSNDAGNFNATTFKFDTDSNGNDRNTISTKHDDTTKTANDGNTIDAPPKLKLINEAEFTTTFVSFVYPQDYKKNNSVFGDNHGDPISYVHTKLRKENNSNPLTLQEDGNGKANEGEGGKDHAVEDEDWKTYSIEDILNLEKKKKRKGSFDRKDVPGCTEEEGRSAKNRKRRRSKEEDHSDDSASDVNKHSIKRNKKEEKMGAKNNDGDDAESNGHSMHPNEIQDMEVDVRSKTLSIDVKKDPSVDANSQTDGIGKQYEDNGSRHNHIDESLEAEVRQGRSRSDSLCDPLKSRISGRTVEDAIKDKSGRRPRSNSTDGELKLPKRGLCDERMVIRNYQWDREIFRGGSHAPPRGFINLGNTCFLNSTLQCLTYLPTFCQCVALLPNHAVEQSNGKKKKVNVGRQITQYLRNLMRKAHGLDGEVKQAPLAPKAIVRSISSLGGSHKGYKFRPGRQEDAHEFLVHLLDAMNDGELRAAGIDQNKSGWRDRLPIPRLDETTLTHRMFGGYLRSQVSCTKCKYNSNTYDPFLDLSLEVSGKKVNSLHDALTEFTRKETLDTDNKWKCSGCKKRVCASKQLTIYRPPLTLCIQLKRFSFGAGFGGFMQYQGFSHYAGKGMGRKGGSKVQKRIEFPATLKLPLSDGRKCEYTLTGVIVHIGGSATSGHYTAFVRRVGKQGASQWLNMDDSFVEPVAEKTVLRNQDAYVLFYCRKEVDLELPSLPRRSFESAEDAVKSSRAKSKLKTNDRSDSLSREEKKGEHVIATTPNKAQDAVTGTQVHFKKGAESKQPLEQEENEFADALKDNNEQESPLPVVDEIAPPVHNEAKEKLHKSNVVKGTNTVTTLGVENNEYSSKVDQNKSKKAYDKIKAKELAEKKNKKAEITIDMGSRGKVNIKVGKLKNRKPWKSPSAAKAIGTKVHLLGNTAISGWDDEDADVDNTAVRKKKEKAQKLREFVAKETKEKTKDRKRKMYQNSWDAGLDAGKTKKIKEKKQNWFDSKSPEEKNSFQRIQESLTQMRRGRKGHQNTSMKKRRRLNK